MEKRLNEEYINIIKLSECSIYETTNERILEEACWDLKILIKNTIINYNNRILIPTNIYTIKFIDIKEIIANVRYILLAEDGFIVTKSCDIHKDSKSNSMRSKEDLIFYRIECTFNIELEKICGPLECYIKTVPSISNIWSLSFNKDMNDFNPEDIQLYDMRKEEDRCWIALNFGYDNIDDIISDYNNGTGDIIWSDA